MFKDFPFHRVNWKTSSFIIATTLISLIGVPLYLINYGLPNPVFQLSMFFFFTVATIMSITLGYHRLFSHLSFKATWPVKFLTLVFGAAAFENSCLSWASDHRHHHKHVDHDGDPYDISRGFFYAHVGWLLFKLDPMPLMDNVNDLKKDKLVMWQDKWVHLIGVVAGLAIPPFIGYFVGGASVALGTFLIAGILRILVVHHCTFFINSLCHTLGTRPYNSGNSARDSAIMAVFTCGEGYHNYHHAFQHDYRNGVKPWQFDPTKWMIWTLSKLGLTSGLRRVSEAKILLAEMREAKRLIEQKKEENGEKDAIASLSERLAKCCKTIDTAIADKVELSKSALKDLNTETRAVVKAIGRVKVAS